MSERFQKNRSGILVPEAPKVITPGERNGISINADPFYQRLAWEVVHKKTPGLPVGVLLDAESILMRALYGQRILTVQAHGDDRTASEGTLQQLAARFNMDAETVMATRGGGGTDFTGSVIRPEEKMEGIRLEEEVRASEISGLRGIYELNLRDGNVLYTTDTVLNLVYLFRQRKTNGKSDPDGQRVAVVIIPEGIGHDDHQAMYLNSKAAREIAASDGFPELGEPNDPIALSPRIMVRNDRRYTLISDITGMRPHIWRVWGEYRTQAANLEYPPHFEGEWAHDALRRGLGAESSESFEAVDGVDPVFRDERSLDQFSQRPVRIEPDKLHYIRVRG